MAAVALNRRQLLAGATVGALLRATVVAGAADPGAAVATPWLRTLYRLYVGPDGQSRVDRIALGKPAAREAQWLVRQKAELVTLGAMAPNYRIDWHHANAPTLLIPILGTIFVELADGTRYEASLGDVIFAEDCSGRGHVSGAGAMGNFGVTIALPKTAHCLDPGHAPFDILSLPPA